MKRRSVVLIIFIALGITANIAVALGCTLAARRHFESDKRHRYLLRWRASVDVDYFGMALSTHRDFRGMQDDQGLDFKMKVLARLRQRYDLERVGYFEYRESEPSIDVPDNASEETVLDLLKDIEFRMPCSRKIRIEAGWPLRSLWVERDFLFNADHEYREMERGHFPETCYMRALPYKPILGGFALNTLMYSAAFGLFYLVAIAPGTLRRRSRIKRGLCPACAYPAGVNAICTECGRDLPQGLAHPTGCPRSRE